MRAHGAGVWAGAGSLSPADRLSIPAEFTAALDSWKSPGGELLEQVVRGAGSIRRAATMIDIPAGTLSAWVRAHRQRGTWPAFTRQGSRNLVAMIPVMILLAFVPS
jgi:hypothetical protein